MDVDATPRPRLPFDVDLYARALDKIIRDTEDGILTWTAKKAQSPSAMGEMERYYTIYTSEVSDGILLLHGDDVQTRMFEESLDPAGFAATQRGEAKLYLVDRKGRKGPFPPARRSVFQPTLDNLLTAVRLRTETPEAEAFARRFLGEG